MLNEEAITGVSLHPFMMFMFVSFSNEEALLNALEKLEVGVLWSKYGSTVHGWRCDVKTTQINVRGVQKEVWENEMKDVFSNYGRVKFARRGMWKLKGGKSVYDGSWSVGLCLDPSNGKPPLPTYIARWQDGECWQVHNSQDQGNGPVCYFCDDSGHVASKCPAQRQRQRRGRT